MDDTAQKNNQQTGSVPVDTSLGDGMSAPPFPIGGQTDASQPAATPPAPVQITVNNEAPAAPVSAPVAETPPADTTGGNIGSINAAPPPPGDGQTVTTFKPVRGKFGAKGIIATVFGILVLVAATIVGVTQVGQVQIFREKASNGCTSYVGLQCNSLSQQQSCVVTDTFRNVVCDAKIGCIETDRGTIEFGAVDVSSNCTPISGGAPVADTSACTPEKAAECGGLNKTCSANVCVDSVGGGTSGCQTNADCENGLKCNPDPSDSKKLICSTGTNVCQAGEAKCGDYCASTQTDVNNCGGCGTRCTGTGAFCQGGQCKTGGTNTCAGGVWEKWTCVGANKTEGSGCQEGTPQISTTQPDFDTGFCGVQQIDCSNNTSLQFSKEDKTGCATASAPPGGNTMGCNGCDCGVIDANGSNNRQNCYWDGNQCLYSEAACSTGENNGKAKCASIGLQLNGEFTNKKGKVANGWHTATLSEVQALSVGDKVRIIVAGGSANGANPANMSNFTKARVSINGGGFIEFTDHDDTISNNPNTLGVLTARKFRYEYTIPAGITDFMIQGQVFYKEGQNPGWH